MKLNYYSCIFTIMDVSTQYQPSCSEVRAKRVQYIRKHLLDITRPQFCEDTDIAIQSLKGWELAWGGGLTAKGAEKIVQRAKSLGLYCTTSWLLHGIGAKATHFTHDLETSNQEDKQIVKELLLFREQSNTIDTAITDDAMLPLLYPGNFVAGILTRDIKNCIGKECIAVDEHDNVYVRVIKESNKPDLYNLTCLNDQPNLAKKEIRNIKLKAAAIICWIRRKSS